MKQLTTALLLLPLLTWGQSTPVYQKPWPIYPLNPASYSIDLAGSDSLTTITAVAYTTTGLRLRANLQPVVSRISPRLARLTYPVPAGLPPLSQVRVSAGSLVRLILDVNASSRNTSAPSSSTLTFTGSDAAPVVVTINTLWADLMAFLL